MVVGSIPIRRNALLFINIFISSLWYQGKKRGVEFRRSTRKTLKIGGRSVLTLGSLRLLINLLYDIRYGVKLKKKLILISVNRQ